MQAAQNPFVIGVEKNYPGPTRFTDTVVAGMGSPHILVKVDQADTRVERGQAVQRELDQSRHLGAPELEVGIGLLPGLERVQHGPHLGQVPVDRPQHPFR